MESAFWHSAQRRVVDSEGGVVIIFDEDVVAGDERKVEESGFWFGL